MLQTRYSWISHFAHLEGEHEAHAWEERQPAYAEHVARAREGLKLAHLDRHPHYSAGEEQAHHDRRALT